MNIKDLMTDDLSKITEFEAACDDLVNSRYILAESKIIKILQTVALSTVLQRIITGALKGFDYAAEAAKWKDGNINPPSEEKAHVALVFCILADIDNRRIFLSDFLRKFFFKGDINSAFSYFCETMIIPFKTYVVGALSQAHKDVVDLSLFESKVMRLAEVIEKYNGFDTDMKEEYILLCDNIATKARTDFSVARTLAAKLYLRLCSIPEMAPFVSEIAESLGSSIS